VASEGNRKISSIVDETIYIPKTEDFLSPILNVVPLQLLAYYIALRKGCSVDKPRNLAKSVTVE
jgi:glucosamine--fructose-6-phosphate aminotransferase (isomerizing)